MSSVPERKLYADAKGVLHAVCGHKGTRDQLVVLDGDLYCAPCRTKKLNSEPKIHCRCGHVVPARNAVGSNLGTLCRPCYESETRAAAAHAKKVQEDLNKRHRYLGERCWACLKTEYLHRTSGGSYACRDHVR
jgi:hypothetical protein